MAATRSDHHVAVFLQDDIGAVVEIQDGDGVELCRGAAWFWNHLGVDEVNLRKKNTKVKTEGQNNSTLLTVDGSFILLKLRE